MLISLMSSEILLTFLHLILQPSFQVDTSLAMEFLYHNHVNVRPSHRELDRPSDLLALLQLTPSIGAPYNHHLPFELVCVESPALAFKSFKTPPCTPLAIKLPLPNFQPRQLVRLRLKLSSLVNSRHYKNFNSCDGYDSYNRSLDHTKTTTAITTTTAT